MTASNIRKPIHSAAHAFTEIKCQNKMEHEFCNSAL